jgi:hypothetical protein
MQADASAFSEAGVLITGGTLRQALTTGTVSGLEQSRRRGSMREIATKLGSCLFSSAPTSRTPVKHKGKPECQDHDQ